ncbi:MAG: hypothetical protein ACRD0H_27880, partial [Actinomycetes bacterium]
EHRRVLVDQLGKGLEERVDDRTLALCVRLIIYLTERDRPVSRRLRRDVTEHRQRTAEVPSHQVMLLLDDAAQRAVWTDIATTRPPRWRKLRKLLGRGPG